MTIREIEQRSGLERTNIRFYEREGLITPQRHDNGYRDYSEEDLQLLMKIKLLRRLGFSLEVIRALKDNETALEEALAKRLENIGLQRRELNVTEQVCQEMQKDGAEFVTLDAEHYLKTYDNALQIKEGIRPTVPDSDKVLPVHCPWRRYFARAFDTFLMSCIVIALIAVIGNVNISLINSVVEWLLGLLAWGILIPVEGLLLSKFGTTPGKWIMGIRIEHEDGRLLTFKEAAYRTLTVFCIGEGFTIPLYNLWRLGKSFKDTSNGKQLEWEAENCMIVKEFHWKRCMAYIGSYAFIMVLFSALSFIPAIPKHRGGDLTVQEFTENYNKMARFYDMVYGELKPNGIFWQQGVENSNIMSSTFEEGDPLKLYFVEENGVLQEIAFDRQISSILIGPNLDIRGKQVVQLSVLSYVWADSNIIKTYVPINELLEEIVYHTDGTIQQEIEGYQLIYSIESTGETLDNSKDAVCNNYNISFKLKRSK